MAIVATNESILILGGGISGMTTALEINLERVRAKKNLCLLTMTEVVGVDGEAGNYYVTVKTTPRDVHKNGTACLLLVE